jgi:hypothetical protein
MTYTLLSGSREDGDMTSSGGADDWDPPVTPLEGLLAGSRPVPTWEDFEEASRLAAADAEASGTLPE